MSLGIVGLPILRHLSRLSTRLLGSPRVERLEVERDFLFDPARIPMRGNWPACSGDGLDWAEGAVGLLLTIIGRVALRVMRGGPVD